MHPNLGVPNCKYRTACSDARAPLVLSCSLPHARATLPTKSYDHVCSPSRSSPSGTWPRHHDGGALINVFQVPASHLRPRQDFDRASWDKSTTEKLQLTSPYLILFFPLCDYEDGGYACTARLPTKELVVSELSALQLLLRTSTLPNINSLLLSVNI